jgi:hypothetical protein
LSLVSVQSNEDAIITSWQHDKLHHPMVKAWAEDLRRKLPSMVRGGVPYQQQPVNVILQIGPPGGHKDAPATAKCGCGGHPTAPATEPAKATMDALKCPKCDLKLDDGKCPKCGYTKPKAAPHKIKRISFGEASPTSVKQDGQFSGGPGVPMPYLEDSWEDTQSDLEAAAIGWLKQNGISSSGYGYGGLVLLGTFDDHAIVCIRNYDSSSDRGMYTCYQGRWLMDADGDPQWDGMPEPVELAVTHEGPTMPDAAAVASLRQKTLESFWKAAKISKKNLGKLEQAQSLVHSVRTTSELSYPTKAIADKAHGLIGEVVSDCKAPSGQPMETAAEYSRKLLDALKSGQSMDADAADYLAAILTAKAEAARAVAEEKSLALLLAS